MTEAQRRIRGFGCAVAFVSFLALAAEPASGTGSVVSEGDTILRADVARDAFGVTGKGVRVGVISDGVFGLDQAKGTGDLSSGTCGTQSNGVTTIDTNLCRGIGQPVDFGSEGTAMMEIIHDLAPGAELRFCTPTTNLDMKACIEFLAGAARIVVDDLGFFSEPYFEDGVVAKAAAKAVTDGAVYVSAAGNEADIHYQGLYVDSSDGLGSHQIGGGNTVFNVTGDSVTVVLQWSNPFGASTDNYDLCLSGEAPADCAAANFNTKDPFEAVVSFPCPSPTGCEMQVRRISGGAQTLELFVLDGTLATADQVKGDSVVGHPAVPGVLAMAAIAAADPGHDEVEFFSSRGPSTIEFPAPQSRQKPDFAAIDGVSVTGAGGFPSPFFGTSASAPHAAAVVALMLEASPGLRPARVQKILQQTAVPLGSSVPNADAGFGRIDAFAAVQAALAPTTLTAALTLTNDVRLAWIDNSAVETGFEIERKTGTGSFQRIGTVAASVNRFVDRAVNVGQVHTYRVRAVTAKGASTFSNEASLGRLLLSPPVVTFLPTRTGAVLSKSLVVRNVGPGLLTGTVGTLTGPFAVTSGSGDFSLAPGKSKTVTLRFSPVAAGDFVTTLVITSTDGNRATVNVRVRGTAK